MSNPSPDNRYRKNDVLTIGIISKNGIPFLQQCLSSLPADKVGEKPIEVILVDCCSTDETLNTMIKFSKQRSNVRVFKIEGIANAAVARNVVLDHTSGNFLILLDGDTILSREFIDNGIQEIESSSADAVTGALQEQWYDTDNNPQGHLFYRITVEKSSYVRTSGGNIFLGPKALDSGIRFDELLRRGQDRDFTLRLSEHLKILQIPKSMGIHLTHHYYSPKRIKEFYRHSYQRPLGLFLRKHGTHLDRLWLTLKLEIGIVIGFSYYFLLLAGLLLENSLILGSLFVLMTVDYSRFFIQRRTNEFIPIRLVSPIMVTQGLLGIGEIPPVYSIKEINGQ